MHLQTMEGEWRKTLFERFRAICREEMMDVMQTLVSNIKAGSPEELERKLSELSQLQQSSRDSQTELFSTMTATNEQLRNLAKKLEEQPPPPQDPQLMENISKGQEAMSRDVISKQEESTRQIQEDVRNSAQLSRSSLTKAVVITTLTVLLLCAAAVYSLRFLSPATVISETELQQQAHFQRQVATASAEMKALAEQKTALLKDMQDLTARRDALQADIRQTLETQRTVQSGVTLLQQQLVSLQQLQEHFRFKLVRGESGGVYVEIPPEAKPFQHAEKTYIQVK